MGLEYLHLSPGDMPTHLTGAPFRALIVAEIEVAQDWRNDIAEWLVKSGCLYAVAWGADCEAWHDTIDWTNLEEFDLGDIPADRFVMTTWHANEPMSQAMWFAGHCADHPDVPLDDTIIVHVSATARQDKMLNAYADSQKLHIEEI